MVNRKAVYRVLKLKGWLVHQRPGTPRPRASRSAHERDITAMQTALGEQAFTSEWRAGRTLSIDEAVAEARESVPV